MPAHLNSPGDRHLQRFGVFALIIALSSLGLGLTCGSAIGSAWGLRSSSSCQCAKERP